MDYLPDIPPEYPAEVPTEFLIRETKLGDGFSERRATGINNVSRVMTLSWMNITTEEKQTLENFFNEKKGVEAFLMVTPGESVARRYICKKHSPKAKTPGFFDYSAELTLVNN